MKSAKHRDLFPGALEMMILQTLKRKPLHGYALAQHIKQTSEELLQVEEGSLYPALQRLETQGWIEAEWGTSENNRKARFYSLTKLGKAQLQKETSHWRKLVAAMGRVLGPEVEG